MKRSALLFLFILIGSSFALSDGLFSFGVHGNFANLNVAEPLHSVYGSGFGGGLHGDFHFGVVTLRLNAEYLSFGADHDVYTTLVYNALVVDYPDLIRQDVRVDGGGTIGIFSFGLNGKFSFPQRQLSPYLIGGAGISSFSVGTISATLQNAPIAIETGLINQTKPMVDLGGGVDFPLGGSTLFLEAKYTWIFNKGETNTYLPVTLGVTF
jgi:hypothetical protein